MPENHPKIETKPAKRWLMKYAERFIVAWNVTEILKRKGRVKRRQNSLHVYPRLKWNEGSKSRFYWEWNGH